MVIQGSGGTGKTMTVISGVKQFVRVVCEVTGQERWMDYLLLLAPTNAVALSIGGKTIDAAELQDQLGQALWTGASFQNCHPLAVLTW
jgi:hypothetical protein